VFGGGFRTPLCNPQALSSCLSIDPRQVQNALRKTLNLPTANPPLEGDHSRLVPAATMSFTGSSGPRCARIFERVLAATAVEYVRIRSSSCHFRGKRVKQVNLSLELGLRESGVSRCA
jgi:hypothetical protein